MFWAGFKHLLFDLEQVYQGYADDPRNTDNAWIETTAVNYHDETGMLTLNLKLQVSECHSTTLTVQLWLQRFHVVCARYLLRPAAGGRRRDERVVEGDQRSPTVIRCPSCTALQSRATAQRCLLTSDVFDYVTTLLGLCCITSTSISCLLISVYILLNNFEITLCMSVFGKLWASMSFLSRIKSCSLPVVKICDIFEYFFFYILLSNVGILQLVDQLSYMIVLWFPTSTSTFFWALNL